MAVEINEELDSLTDVHLRVFHGTWNSQMICMKHYILTQFSGLHFSYNFVFQVGVLS